MFLSSLHIIFNTCCKKVVSAQVSISQLQLLPGSAVQPRFEVGLLISNPNGFDLKLKGMSYSLSVNDYKLVAGVTADIPVVPAYGTAELALPATANVVNGIRLFQNLLAQSTQDISYRLEAALDTGNLLLPKIRIIEEGRVPVGLPVQGSPVTQPVRF